MKSKKHAETTRRAQTEDSAPRQKSGGRQFSWLLSILALSLLAVLPARATGNTNFVYIRQADFNLTPIGYIPNALGDLNHDGKLDLIHEAGTNQIVVQMGLGNGQFGSPTYYTASSLPGFIQVADMNHDGYLDVVVANLNDSSVSVFLNNGDGTLQAARTTPVGMVPTDMAVTDYNKDGNPDIILTGYRLANGPLDGYVVTLPGSGNGYFGTATSFTPSSRTAYTGTRGLAVGDLNGDGYPDFVVANPGGGHCIMSFINNKNGTFTPTVEMQASGLPGRLALADFNQDGKLDIAIVTAGDTMYGNTGNGNNVEVVMGNGDGTFGTLTSLPSLSYDLMDGGVIYSLDSAGDSMVSPGVNILATDLNGDGNPDLAACAQITSSGANYIGVLKGAANGTFTPAAQLGADS
ncbi:MAG TPA: VCBS repeat-containing protein, partial [Verrucomicrobiae bacterium]